MFFSGHSHTSFFQWVEKLSESINFCYTSRFVGVTWGDCRRRRRRLRMGSLASLVGQGESVSLIACSLCRCHLVIIRRQPSASWSCRTWPLSLLGPVWLAGSMLLSLSILTCYSTCLHVQKARLVRTRGKTEDTYREKPKSKLWSLCHIVNRDKWMMHPQFFPSSSSPLTADCLASHPQRCWDAEVCCQNKLQPPWSAHPFHFLGVLPRKCLTWLFFSWKLSSDTKANEGSHHIAKIIVSPKNLPENVSRQVIILKN